MAIARDIARRNTGGGATPDGKRLSVISYQLSVTSYQLLVANRKSDRD